MERLSEVMDTSFFTALEKWKAAARKASIFKLQAKEAYAAAYLSSEGRNETSRTSEADLRSMEEQREAELARLEMKANEYLLEFTLAGIKSQ